MKKLLRFYLFYTFFWIAFFFVSRILFLAYEFGYTHALSISEIATAFLLGLRMDISTTGYFLLIISFLSVLFLRNLKLYAKIIYVLTMVLLALCSILIISNLELYRNWGFHIDYTPFQYINTPGAMLASTSIWLIVLLLLGMIALFWGFRKLYIKMIGTIEFNPNFIHWKYIPVLIFITASTFLPIRGSIGTAAMNTGMMYFSDKQIANHLGINPVWNFLYNINKRDALTQTMCHMPQNKADSLLKDMTHTSKSYCNVLNKKRPNVLIFVLESFTAHAVAELGGVDGVLPNFSKIAKGGILFTNLIANGNRTDKGLVAIFSGYPAQPVNSIIKFPQKSQNLPFLSRKLKDEGYTLSMNYGGDINFTNIRSYMLNAGFNDIMDIQDFPAEYRTAQWGVHDEYLLDTLLYKLHNAQQPFFTVALTLSSHPPFDVPAKSKFSGTDDASLYLNSLHYADSCLGIFFEKAMQQSWWDNTLVILVADHSTALPGYYVDNDPSKYTIPMIWTGGAVKYHDTIIDRYISQVDISKSLLTQLHIDSKEFIYSKNIFADSLNEFGFYSYNNGFGYLKDSLTFVYDQGSMRNIRASGIVSAHDTLCAKAYWQTFNNDFVKR